MYLFSKIDPSEVIACYLWDLEAQGIDISGFILDWLPDQTPNFMKRKREPSKKTKKNKSLKLGESLATQKQPMPLRSSAPGKSPISEVPHISGSKQILSSLSQPPSPSLPLNLRFFYPHLMNLKLLTLTNLHLHYLN